MSAQEVLLVRHPEIDRGPVPVCYGQLDLGLTPRGEEMIGELVTRAREWRPEVVLSSDLQRCLKPARAIAEACGVRLEIDAAWREISMGEWEGKIWSELEAQHPQMLQNWMQDYVKLSPPGGETYGQLADRTMGVFNQLASRPEVRIWVMTHGGVVRSVVSRVLGLPLEKSFSMETAYAAGALLRASATGWKLIFG